ncbi:unnamed protein product [Symbiodinium sp. CCMP2592]|nr:unnamed protein product [Symbiodinium sp. CCMP2592]
MASDHDAFADWLKTLNPTELEKLKALHSASAQTAADTAVQDDTRPCDSSASLSPRSAVIYQNQEAFYHAQEGCYTGPIPACFDYIPPQDVEDLDDAATAQPSQPETSQPSQHAEPTPPTEAAAVTEQPIEEAGEYLPMETPSSSSAFHAAPQAGLYSMMGQLIDMASLIKRPDLGVARESGAYLTADAFAVSAPANFFPNFPNAPLSQPDTTPMPHAKADPPPIKAVPAGAPKLEATGPADLSAGAVLPASQARARSDSDRGPASLYAGPYRPPKPFGLAVIWDARSWINFYGGEPPKSAVEIDVETYFYTADPEADTSDEPSDLPPCPPLPEWYSADTGVLRYWHLGATGTGNPRNMGKQGVPPLCLQDISRPPEPLVDRRKHITVEPPKSPYLYKPPAMALPRLPCPNMRNCIIVPSLTLPQTFELDPAFARMYYMGSRGEMRCGLPCSTVPFCPFHSACGRELNSGAVEQMDKHIGHQCSRFKEFTDLGRSPFEWFSAVPPQAQAFGKP